MSANSDVDSQSEYLRSVALANEQRQIKVVVDDFEVLGGLALLLSRG